MGVAFPPAGNLVFHNVDPVRVSNARKACSCVAPMKMRPDRVVIARPLFCTPVGTGNPVKTPNGPLSALIKLQLTIINLRSGSMETPPQLASEKAGVGDGRPQFRRCHQVIPADVAKVVGIHFLFELERV